jgi:hypothetical protein
MGEADWQNNIIGQHETERIGNLLRDAHTIAVVGMKETPYLASYYVPKYLIEQGYEIIPINPKLSQIASVKCYPSLRNLPVTVDIVEVFRRSEDVLIHAEEALELKPKAFWMQSGIINEEAAKLLAQAGILVVMDRCMYIDHKELIARG